MKCALRAKVRADTIKPAPVKYDLAFRNLDTDWQIWIEVGARPIPRKYVITSKAVAGAPQYTLRIKEWRTEVPADALLLYLSFYAHRRGAPELPTLLLQISTVALPTVAVLSPEGAGGFATTLLLAGCVALITVWVAHAAFPAPAIAATNAAPPSATGPAEPARAAHLALLETFVLVPVLTWYILDATQVAVVVLIIIVALLRQHNPKQGQRAALGLILGNLIGGIAAAIVYNLVILNNTLLFFTTVCLAASLIFAGRIVTAGDRAPIYAVAFATFILLLGLGMTPLPGGTGEAFVDRLFYVLLASAYAIGGLSLVERWRNDRP